MESHTRYITLDEIRSKSKTGEIPPKVWAVLNAAAKAGHTSVKEIRSCTRARHVVLARRTAAWALRDLGFSETTIGHWLGGRHHSSISHYFSQGRPDAGTKKPHKPFHPSAPDLSGEWAI